jgi:hypothetical protein
MPDWRGAPLELTEGTNSSAQRACIRARCIGATRPQTNLQSTELPPPDPRSLCPLSSTEFVEPPPPHPKKFLGTPLSLTVTIIGECIPANIADISVWTRDNTRDHTEVVQTVSGHTAT